MGTSRRMCSKTKKIKFKGGLRAEYTDISGVFANSLPIKNDYFNLFPSAVVSQTLKDNKTTLKLINKPKRLSASFR